jgi:broad specificity phosphatase PhoE
VTTPTLLALVRHGESEWVAEGRFQGRGDSPLTDTGMRQARAIGTRLAAPSTQPALPLPDRAPTAIWHSPLRRALQTAQAIHQAREADAPLRSVDALTELSQGEWEGLTHEEVLSRYPDQLAAWRADPVRHHAPGGESLAAAQGRAHAALDAIFGREETTDLLSAHAGGALAATPPAGAAAASAAGLSPIPAAPAESVLGYERTLVRPPRPDWAIVVSHDGLLRLMLMELLGIPVERFWAFPFALAAVSVVDLGGGIARLRAHNLDEHIMALSRR